tara:strand:- start:781 stop:1011 length:231 start_codon:yes stop_codon:yes gene_type:complete
MAEKKVKYLFTEGVFSKFINNVMDWSVGKAAQKVKKIMKTDPELGRLTKAANKSSQELQSYLKKRKKDMGSKYIDY